MARRSAAVLTCLIAFVPLCLHADDEAARACSVGAPESLTSWPIDDAWASFELAPVVSGALRIPPMVNGFADDQQPARRQHSVRKGAIVGALIGAGIGAFTSRFSDCPGTNATGKCPGARVAYFLLATGTGAGVGIGINALFEQQTALPTVRGVPAERPLVPPHRRFRLAVRW
jgi:hypothetical protein